MLGSFVGEKGFARIRFEDDVFGVFPTDDGDGVEVRRYSLEHPYMVPFVSSKICHTDGEVWQYISKCGADMPFQVVQTTEDGTDIIENCRTLRNAIKMARKAAMELYDPDAMISVKMWGALWYFYDEEGNPYEVWPLQGEEPVVYRIYGDDVVCNCRRW